MAKDRRVRNLTGESSYAAVTFSESGGTCWPARALLAGKLLFVSLFDRARRPILGYGVGVATRSL